MALTKEDRLAIIDKYRLSDSDTGSAEVQVALLTERIRYLTTHLKAHKKDHATRRGLLTLVGKRSRLLRYVHHKDYNRYQTLIQSLGLRK
jgi:small subunit ribosomal protein S15